ncbi:hypothetical protein PNA2_1391 [Pyrococcus sp. NA2]|uniref:hypothetical protein n=1 Tax=Pyrococcus sp. (strain NA2) TaxID=342949 RepID=UPI000209AEA4|nr:hypothetical protein [Pyrococcus sp. NA2]AEC52306.1 hypothetical protein PNA2_1391 [Pyrococcus sp. NA2]
MFGRKFLVGVLLLITLSGIIVSALNYLASNEDSITRILGYDVYKIEGSGDYIIYYPLPNGSIKVLKRGRAGSFFPVFVKVPREEWTEKLSTSGKVLYAPPTPLILYITEDGRLGVRSITASRIRLEDGESLDLKGSQVKSPCPDGWIDFGGRYCLSPQWDLHFESNAKTKTFDEWITVMGLKIENNVAEEVEYHWTLVLSGSTYSYWMIGIDVGPFTVLSVSKGHRFEGQALNIGYASEGPLMVDSDTWERYLNVRAEYIIVHAKVPAYDKLTGEHVWIEIAQTYPLKIHSTGEYTIWESSTRGIYFTESNGNNPPKITTTPNIWSLPKEAEWKRKRISNTGNWEGAIYIRQSNAFSSTSSLSIPIGYAGGRYLSSISPTLGRLASALSLTFGFSFVKYSVDIKPRRDCYAMHSVLNVKVGERDGEVEVPLMFGIITDAPCNPKTGLCTSKET